MPSTQLRLLPAAQPLVLRLGVDWFRQVPTSPGVYRFYGESGELLYVGKARNIRQRLASYRRTNRQIPRIVRLIHLTARVEWQTTVDEAAALALEAELILGDQPRFNRAGRWKAPPCWVRIAGSETHLEATVEREAGETRHGPLPSSCRHRLAALLRLLWLASDPARQPHQLPLSLAALPIGDTRTIALPAAGAWIHWTRDWLAHGDLSVLWELAARLEPRMAGFASGWILEQWEWVVPRSSQPSDTWPAG